MRETGTKLLAFDLDYTLLDSQKRLSEENLAALHAAAEKGVILVPATGRVYQGLPEKIRELPFVRYCILGNGAMLYDSRNDIVIAEDSIPLAEAEAVFDFAEANGLPYDIYAEGSGYMNREWFDTLENYIDDEATIMILRRLRAPVDDFRNYVRTHFKSVMKIQIYFKDPAFRIRMIDEMPKLFPELSVTSSLPMNMEVNGHYANKGSAIIRLCEALGIDVSESMAIGDGLNDLEMIKAAGIGVAMSNAESAVKAAADYITGSCEESGLALAIKKLLL